MPKKCRNIAVDLGNTQAKVGVFEDGVLVDMKSGIPFHLLDSTIADFQPVHVIISSVKQKVEQLAERIDAQVIILDHNTSVPIVNKYATPETLGKDRLAAVIGAFSLGENTNTLVIDVGTCITYDVLNDRNEFLGGSISPGIELKFKALHNFTANLPLVEEVGEPDLIGNTTHKAIMSGVINGTAAEIDEIIRMYKHKFPHLRIVICGGGALELKKSIKSEIEFIPELVLLGLNRILEYNV